MRADDWPVVAISKTFFAMLRSLQSQRTARLSSPYFLL